MNTQELIPHLFRIEYRKIVSVLGKRFGFDQLEIAEDIASDTFLTATQSWGLEGIPSNPTAWLYHVAKNKAKNYLLRDKIFHDKISPEVKKIIHDHNTLEIDLSPENIHDSQLQMMFAICHPAISTESQIGLSLRILCGFGIEEIADAFLTTKDIINKRLYRAKEKLRELNIKIDPIITDIDERLSPVLTTIYLLFNEGYYSISQNNTLRKDLCIEAMRLCIMLVENTSTDKPSVNALLALMCFHISRFDARVNESGELILYEEQDASRWNNEFISKGGYFLKRSAAGNKLSRYHLEAGIAYWNTQKNDTLEKWKSILRFYDQLLKLDYSPIAALNRAYAVSKVNGKEAALIEAQKLNLADNHFYFALLGELYTGIDNTKALQNLERAISLSKTETDKKALQKKVDTLPETARHTTLNSSQKLPQP
jgi:RNA polymerase sigma factor (sigma-70 family)